MNDNFLIAYQNGRLGNKLFTLATLITKCFELNCNPFLAEKWDINNFFTTPFGVYSLSKGITVYKNESPNYFDVNIKKNTLIHGYFQSEKFFKKYSNEIKKMFKTKYENDIKKSCFNLLSFKYTISIHIRRTDYITDKLFNTLPANYYFNAITYILDKINDDDYHFLIFSDDIKYCNTLFGNHPRFTYVNVEGENRDIIEFYLMSYCTHNIIANSSYSWWSAYLNENPNKIIIAPKWEKCYNYDNRDFYPSYFIQLDYNLEDKIPTKEITYIDGFTQLRVYDIFNAINCYSIKDEIGLLKNLPEIFSYNELKDKYDLLCTDNIENVEIDKFKYALVYSRSIPSNYRFLIFENKILLNECNPKHPYFLFLLDLHPKKSIDLYSKVINLNNRNDRWLKLCEQYNPLFKRLSAIKSTDTDFNYMGLSMGAIGCLKSNQWIILNAWLNNAKCALIFEDDIKLCDNFETTFNTIFEKLKTIDFDICQLSTMIWDGKFKNAIAQTKENIFLRMFGSGAHTYIANSNAFNKLINFQDCHMSPADDILQLCNTIILLPFITEFQDNIDSDISKDKKEVFEARERIVSQYTRKGLSKLCNIDENHPNFLNIVFHMLNIK